MKLLRAFNKEQWAAALAAAVGAVWVGGGLAGGLGPAAERPWAPPEAVYERMPVRGPEFPEETFARYWQGRDIFRGEAAARLPVPYLRPPEPREEAPPAPRLRPGPSPAAYHRLASAFKYPVVAPPGAPARAAADLPAASEIEALRKLEEPEVRPRVDRRAEREREFFVAYHKSGAKFEGQLLAETASGEIVLRDKGGRRLTFRKEDLAKWEYNYTYEEQYRLETTRIQPGPKEADERVRLARRLIELGMVREAREELGRALSARRDHLEAALLRGQLAIEEGDYEEALSTWAEAAAAGASGADLYVEAGKVWRSLGLPEAARTAFERALEASVRHHGARLGLARCALDLDRPREALEIIGDYLLKFGGASDTAPAHRAEAHLLRGLAELRLGDLAKAKQDVAEALRLEPGRAEALNASGVILVLEGQTAAGAARFAEAIRAQPYFGEAWTNLATLLLVGGRAAEAEALAVQALQRDPASVPALLVAGLASWAAGRKEAAEALERARQADPGDPEVRAVLGTLALREGADDAALEHFLAALRAEPEYAPAASGAAAAYLRTARRLEGEALAAQEEARAESLRREAEDRRLNAETLLRRVKDLDPSRPQPWVSLACAYAALGRPGDAQAAARMAASLFQGAQAPVDPLVFHVLGYVEYYYAPLEAEEARLASAAREFAEAIKLKAQWPDPFSQRLAAELERILEEIERWKVTAVRLDERFEREPGRTVGHNWIEADEKYGISITLESAAGRGGRARFAGRQAIVSWGVTTLSREFPGEHFQALEATLYRERMGQAECGVSLYHSKQGESWIGFHVGLDRAGKLWVLPAGSEAHMDRRDMSTGWMPVKDAPPDPREVRLRIERGERNRAAYFILQVWNPAAGRWTPVTRELPVNLAGARGPWRVSIFGRAPDGQEYVFEVDNIRVYEQLPQ